MIRAISLGAGVQSSVLLLMAALGELRDLGEMPEYALFSDTKGEPKDVYDHLAWLEGETARLTNGRMQCIRLSKGDLEADVRELLTNTELTGSRASTPPFFTPGRDGMAAPIRRQCTETYKIDPIRDWMREKIGHPKGRPWKKPPAIECWIGISTDEIQRMTDARDRFVKNRWPLIEKRMSRGDCLEWFGRRYPGRKLAKSACYFCPFKKNDEWRRTRDEQPEEWARAVEFDKAIRAGSVSSRGEWFLHRKLQPLDEVDLSSAADRGQTEFGFLQECQGMCGL
jgi:hypothetical protein